jgi:hypothetical protein
MASFEHELGFVANIKKFTHKIAEQYKERMERDIEERDVAIAEGRTPPHFEVYDGIMTTPEVATSGGVDGRTRWMIESPHPPRRRAQDSLRRTIVITPTIAKTATSPPTAPSTWFRVASPSTTSTANPRAGSASVTSRFQMLVTAIAEDTFFLVEGRLVRHGAE